MALFRTSLQVIAAFAIVLILFVIAYNLFNREAARAMRQASQLRNQVNVFTGIKDMAYTNEVYDTVNDMGGMFLDLKPSANQRGGIEMTYNFWLYQKSDFQPYNASSSTSANIDEGLTTSDIVLLLRGNNTVKSYNNVCDIPTSNVYVKCPLIKLQNYGNSLTVEFNTEKSIDVIREGAKNVCGQFLNNWDEANQHKVSIRGLKTNNDFLNKWFMVTVMIQDTYPDDPLPFRNRVRVRIYINGVLELDQYVNDADTLGQAAKEPTILKPNNGNLYIMPQITINPTANPQTKTAKPGNAEVYKVMMADLSYFNHVLDADQIVAMYEKSFTKKHADPPKNTSGPFSVDVSPVNKKGMLVKSTSEL